jgi:hypothetical protein
MVDILWHPSAEDEKNARGFARKVLDYGLALWYNNG